MCRHDFRQIVPLTCIKEMAWDWLKDTFAVEDMGYCIAEKFRLIDAGLIPNLIKYIKIAPSGIASQKERNIFANYSFFKSKCINRLTFALMTQIYLS